MEDIKFMLDEGAYAPERAHEADAGWDLRTPVDVTVSPLINLGAMSDGSATINTGVHIAIPHGWVGILKAKSGLNVKHNLTGTGVIDSEYNGSIVAKIYNRGKKEYKFKRGDKIIQIVIVPIHTGKMVQVDSLDETERGSNGFGSTGR